MWKTGPCAVPLRNTRRRENPFPPTDFAEEGHLLCHVEPKAAPATTSWG